VWWAGGGQKYMKLFVTQNDTNTLNKVLEECSCSHDWSSAAAITEYKYVWRGSSQSRCQTFYNWKK